MMNKSAVIIIAIIVAVIAFIFIQSQSKPGTNSGYTNAIISNSANQSRQSTVPSGYTNAIISNSANQSRQSTVPSGYGGIQGNNYNQTQLVAMALAACNKAGVSPSQCQSYCMNNPSQCGIPSNYVSGPVNIAACGSNSTYFNALPLSSSNFSSITPLGWVSPGGHVLPSDHIYWNLIQAGSSEGPYSGTPINTSVYAPGNVTIYQISGRSYGGSNYDYSIYFLPCNNFTVYFHHLHMISAKLLSNFTPPYQCANGTTNAGQINSCNKFVNIKVKTGELIGYIGGVPFSQGGTSALDMGVYDPASPVLVYANNSRYSSRQLHVACPINYFPRNMQNSLLARMGSGNTIRTKPPLCGQNDYDVAGTAQGNWFRPGTPTPYIDEGPLISLAYSNIIPSEGLFSTGVASNIPGLSGATYYFNSASTGFVNRNFSDITSNGNIYCYGSLSSSWNIIQGFTAHGIILLQLVNSNTLRIEYQNSGSCGLGPWGFTQNHADFYR